MVSGEEAAGAASTVTLSISGEALGALDAYLQSGAARGLPFEQALLQAVGRHGEAAASTRCVLSQRTLRRVHEFVAANLARDIGIADIAEAASLSPYHLGRSYHQATGQSLWQYVLQRRAHLAQRLIREQPGVPLAEIAVLCGFHSYSQFIAAFRKTHGLAPGAYRQALDRAAQ